MPDAGKFETGNASASPAGWGDAFAALPQEAPDSDGWQRLQARLPVATSPRVRRRWPLWLAAAASLGLALALPLWMSHEASIDPPAATASASAAAPKSASADTQQHASVAAVEPPGDHDNSPASDGNVIASSNPGSARKPSGAPRIAPAQRPIRTVAEPAGATRLAQSDTSTQPIESLYAESAQLEQLLAMVRDERVASGASAALSSDLDDRVAGIDAALTEPGLDAAERDRLWRQRVDAMQQLVGIETTRMFSARGDTFNASLVSVD